MSRNPYKASKPPQLKNSVLVYMDILGYQEMIAKVIKGNDQSKFLQFLHAVLFKAKEDLEEKHFKMGDRDLFALKTFTDNIVIGFPILEDGEMEFGRAFGKVADFQLALAVKGLFVRGGISIGNAYIDNIAVFGDALADAYEAENKLARDPRVIITKSAVKIIEKHIGYYSKPAHSPQSLDLLKDSDGQWFVNYLYPIIELIEECGPDYDILEQHKSAVETKLKEFANDPKIFSKYAWVAGYHNSFCEMHSRYFEDKHKIKTELFKSPIKKIYD